MELQVPLHRCYHLCLWTSVCSIGRGVDRHVSHLELRGNKYITNYLNDSFAALRMVQRTVNNVIVVRMYYTIITHNTAIQSLYSVSYLVGVVFRQYYGVNCIHCCLNFQHSYYFTGVLTVQPLPKHGECVVYTGITFLHAESSLHVYMHA